jgi:hypothetical protein
LQIGSRLQAYGACGIKTKGIEKGIENPHIQARLGEALTDCLRFDRGIALRIVGGQAIAQGR